MSNVGQGIAAVAGAVIGWFVGGPTGALYGFEAGLAVGTILSPTKLPGTTGPRLTDNRTTTASLGVFVPFGYGTFAVAGNVMYLGTLIEHSTTTHVGKGAPESSNTTFSYTQSIGIGLCEGESESGQPAIAGILRIWENGALVYDARPQLDGESDDAFAARVSAAGDYASTFVLYTGTHDQTPDPTIEADKGVGNVPAYRHLAYIVYPDRQLRDDQAQRHPNFKFEVSRPTAPNFTAVTIYKEHGTYTWRKPNVSGTVTVKAVGAGGGGGGGSCGDFSGAGSGGGGGAYAEATFPLDDVDGLVTVVVGASGAGGTGATSVHQNIANTGTPGIAGGNSTFGAELMARGGGAGGRGRYTVSTGSSDAPGAGGTTSVTGGSSVTTETGGVGGEGNAGSDASPHPGAGTTLSGAGGGGGMRSHAMLPGSEGGASTDVVGGAGGAFAITNNLTPAVAGSGQFGGSKPEDDLKSGAGGGGGGGAYADQVFVQSNGGPGGDGGQYGAGGGGGGAASTRASVGDAAPTGPMIGGDGGLGAGGFVKVTLTTSDDPIDSARTVGSIVRDLCIRAGLDTSDIITSDVDSVEIVGYCIGSQSTARDCISPLRSVAFFDSVEADGQLILVARGGAARATILADDLGSRLQDADAAPAITVSKAQDTDLPRSLRVNYLSYEHDYETAVQPSPVRVNTDATNDTDVQVAVVLHDDAAAKIAEVLFADAWQSRWIYTFALDRTYLWTTPADVLLLPLDGRLYRVRVTNDTTTDICVRQFTAARDLSDYTSTAIATPVQRPPAQLQAIADTTLVFLDIPALQESDDDAGFYFAAGSAGNGTVYRGAVIQKSIDGATFQAAASATTSGTIGALVADVAAGQTECIDRVNGILVELLDSSKTLESRTEVAVLNGANMAAIGRHGSWELVQYLTAELVSGNVWRVTNLLRGRRGTEHLVGTALTGDKFVVLTDASLYRLVLNNSEIGAVRDYRVVSIGKSNYSDPFEFTDTAVALKPFSPINVAATGSGGDITITWVRRDRLGQSLRSGVELAMSEATEAYQVDIYNALVSPRLLMRTLSASATTATYTTAQQTTDFGAPVDVANLQIDVYQMSAVVGRGTPGVFGA